MIRLWRSVTAGCTSRSFGKLSVEQLPEKVHVLIRYLHSATVTFRAGFRLDSCCLSAVVSTAEVSLVTCHNHARLLHSCLPGTDRKEVCNLLAAFFDSSFTRSLTLSVPIGNCQFLLLFGAVAVFSHSPKTFASHSFANVINVVCVVHFYDLRQFCLPLPPQEPENR